MKNNFWLILIIIFLILSILVNIKLVGEMLRQRDERMELVIPPFSLSQPDAGYTIRADETGTYSIQFSSKDDQKSALIGSSQIPLENFLNIPVQIQGQFRPIYGTPMCHTYCPGLYRAPVVDISNILVK